MKNHPVSFVDLIAPIDVEGFLATHWQRRPLRSKACVAARGLIERTDVEFLLSSVSDPGSKWLDVARHGRSVETAELLSAQGHVRLAGVREFYRAGHTVQLSWVHKRWPAIGVLCRDVERVLSQSGVALARRVGAALHMAPPRARGCAARSDDHDILAVQVSGAASWRVAGKQFRLSAGETLYVPRGARRAARAAEQGSLHVSIELAPCTWGDLFARLMRARPDFREGLPSDSWRGRRPGPALSLGYRARCADLSAADPAPELEAMAADFFTGADTLPGSGLDALHRLKSLGLDTVLRRRRGAFARVVSEGGRSKAYFPGSALTGDSALSDAITAIVGRPRFVVRDLPGVLDDDDRIALIKELVRAGFLEIVGR